MTDFAKELYHSLEDLFPEPTRDGSGKAVNITDFLLEELYAEKHLLPTIIPVGSVGMLAAHGGCGKTIFLTQMTLLMAKGMEVFGIPSSGPVPCLYFMAEGSRSGFQERALATKRSLGISLGDMQWHTQPRGFSEFYFTSPGFERLIKETGAKLIVCDTHGYFHKGDENSASDWKQYVMNPLRALCRKYDCSFVLVHHQTKDTFDKHGHKIDKGWQGGRGTSAMFDDADFYLRLEANGPDVKSRGSRTLHIDKSKVGVSGRALKLAFNIKDAFFYLD